MPERKSTSKRERGAAATEKTDEAPAPPKLATSTADPERIPRLALTLGGVILIIGLALVGGGPSDIGKVVALAGLLVTIYGVHSFGRLGPA